MLINLADTVVKGFWVNFVFTILTIDVVRTVSTCFTSAVFLSVFWMMTVTFEGSIIIRLLAMRPGVEMRGLATSNRVAWR